MTAPPEVATAYPMPPRTPSEDPRDAGPVHSPVVGSCVHATAPPVARCLAGVPRTTTPSAMAKWWPWRLRVSPTSSGSGATRSAEEVCTTPEGETEKISAAVALTSAARNPSDAASEAPNRAFGALVAWGVTVASSAYVDAGGYAADADGIASVAKTNASAKSARRGSARKGRGPRDMVGVTDDVTRPSVGGGRHLEIRASARTRNLTEGSSRAPSARRALVFRPRGYAFVVRDAGQVATRTCGRAGGGRRARR